MGLRTPPRTKNGPGRGRATPSQRQWPLFEAAESLEHRAPHPTRDHGARWGLSATGATPPLLRPRARVGHARRDALRARAAVVRDRARGVRRGRRRARARRGAAPAPGRARARRRAMAGAGAITHSMVPPTPGPLMIAAGLKLDLGVAMMAGLAASILPAWLVLYLARKFDEKYDLPMREASGASTSELKTIVEKKLISFFES